MQSPNYTKCTVSPIIERKQRTPSVMQCLVTWAVRSVDEVSESHIARQRRAFETADSAQRPRVGEQQPLESSPFPAQREAPPYSSPPRQRHQQQHSTPAPYSQAHQQGPTAHHYPSQTSLNSLSSSLSSPSGVAPYPFPAADYSHGPGMPPGYFDVVPGMYPGASGLAGQWGMPGMQVPSMGVAARPFSPLPGYNGVGGGMGWYAGGMGWPGMM